MSELLLGVKIIMWQVILIKHGYSTLLRCLSAGNDCSLLEDILVTIMKITN